MRPLQLATAELEYVLQQIGHILGLPETKILQEGTTRVKFEELFDQVDADDSSKTAAASRCVV